MSLYFCLFEKFDSFCVTMFANIEFLLKSAGEGGGVFETAQLMAWKRTCDDLGYATAALPTGREYLGAEPADFLCV
jgi:hypothetical protein